MLNTASDKSWQDFANCVGENPFTFFPQEDDLETIAKAKAICAECLVGEACLYYALTKECPDQAIWGGMTRAERDQLVTPTEETSR